MAAHAVVLGHQPPAFLDVAAGVLRFVLVVGGQATFLAAKKERGEGLHLVLGEMQVGHAESLRF